MSAGGARGGGRHGEDTREEKRSKKPGASEEARDGVGEQVERMKNYKDRRRNEII